MPFYIICFLSLTPLILSVSSIEPPDIRCTDDFCLEYEVATKCPSFDMSICINETLAVLLPSPTVCNCCDQCIVYIGIGGSCTNGAPGSNIPAQICGPGLVCTSGKCKKMNNPGDDPLIKVKPFECDKNTGRCHCTYKTKTENIKIFGEFNETEQDDFEQCGCSVSAYQAQHQDFKFLPFEGVYQSFARCLPSGSYDPLQCYQGVCGCVDPYTGVYDETVPLVAMSALAEGNPLCYNSTLGHHIGYYNECESFLENLLHARDLLEADGEIFLFPYKVDCNPDGTFTIPPTPKVRKAIEQLQEFLDNFSN